MVERKKINKNELGKTAISSINLGIENPDAYFMSEDDNTRLYAINIGLNVIGVTRVIADATVKGEIKSIKEMVDTLLQLKNESDYPITDEMITDIVAVVENRIKIRNQNN
jgi:predicted nucleic acid-binding protein